MRRFQLPASNFQRLAILSFRLLTRGTVVSDPQAQVQRVLVMDDDTQVHIVLGQVLGRSASRCAGGGRRRGDGALPARDGGRKPFAAVIMDLTIPGGWGRKSVKLLAIDSAARVIVTSAF